MIGYGYTYRMATTTNNTINADLLALMNAVRASGERTTLSILSKAVGMTPIRVRAELTAHFGDEIVFKRGRTGGIFFKDAVTPRSQPKTPAPAVSQDADSDDDFDSPLFDEYVEEYDDEYANFFDGEV